MRCHARGLQNSGRGHFLLSWHMPVKKVRVSVTKVILYLGIQPGNRNRLDQEASSKTSIHPDTQATCSAATFAPCGVEVLVPRYFRGNVQQCPDVCSVQVFALTTCAALLSSSISNKWFLSVEGVLVGVRPAVVMIIIPTAQCPCFVRLVTLERLFFLSPPPLRALSSGSTRVSQFRTHNMVFLNPSQNIPPYNIKCAV